MSLLFFVIVLVTWMLFIVLRDYFWGRGMIIKNGLYYYSNLFFSFFFFRIFKLYIYLFNIFLYVVYFFNSYIINYLKFIKFFDNLFISNYYLKKKNNFSWKVLFFLVGEFTLRKGFYIDNLNQNFNSLCIANQKTFIFSRNQQNLEIFLYGNVLSEGFSKQDSFEKPYIMQQFVHHFKLELFWAIFPTIKCLIILIPSLILLYSSASLKFYDNTVQVTANQWYWNFSSNVLVETEFVPSFFFFSDTFSKSSLHNKDLHYFINEFYNNNFLFDGLFESDELSVYSKDNLLDDELFDFHKNALINKSSFNSFDYDNFNSELFSFDHNFLIDSNVEFVSVINNDSFMIADNDLVLGQQRVLDTDSHLIVSSLRSTKFLVNALDVLHSFVILSTGVKVDAIVGRINEMSVFFLREGLFFGQCSELCGSGHFGMPIVVESLEPFDFFSYFEDKKWVTISKKSLTPFLCDCPLLDVDAEAELKKFLWSLGIN